MAGRIWVVDDEPSSRYPIYTRGNVGEVFPEAVAPLSWSLGARGASELGWRDALVRFGAFDHDEFDDSMCVLGCFGGYAYLNVSISRIMAVRTPGMTPEMMDLAFFGESDAPAYAASPTDESPAHTRRIQQTLEWVFTVDELTDLQDDQRQVDEIVAGRPDLTALSERELVDRARDLMPLFRRLFEQHLFVTYAATVPMGVVTQICTAVGDPTLPMVLLAGLGSVDSAAPSWAMWEMGRMVASSAALIAAFDAGVDGLHDRLRDEPEAAKFVAAFDDFVAAFGSRGPNEWEMRSPTWGTDPELALAAIDRMRVADDAHAPQGHWDERAAEAEAVAQQLSAALADNPEVQGQFVAAVRAGRIFLAGRERSKTTVIKLLHESRLAMHEVGRRMVAAGHFDDVRDFGMLLDSELDDFLADPGLFRRAIAERKELFARLQRLEPPFIVDGRVPPLEEWHERGSTPVAVAAPGDSLGGIPGCPGQYTGRARVILSPDDPFALEPGDVLVAPITDPAWTPLFVTAGAVIVDVGAQASHAVIVARELGIPCVVSVSDATRRIPDGAQVTVDGTTGTVSGV